MTVEEMKAEIDRLRKEIAEAKKKEAKEKKESKPLLPNEIYEKYFPRDPEKWKKRMNPEDFTEDFVDSEGLRSISRIIRRAMFIQRVTVDVKDHNDNLWKPQERDYRFSKRFIDISDEEYDKYVKCFDEILNVIKKYAVFEVNYLETDEETNAKYKPEYEPKMSREDIYKVFRGYSQTSVNLDNIRFEDLDLSVHAYNVIMRYSEKSSLGWFLRGYLSQVSINGLREYCYKNIRNCGPKTAAEITQKIEAVLLEAEKELKNGVCQ